MRALARSLLLLAGAAALPGQPLAAQTVNYAALADTFGEPVTTSVTGKPQRASDAPASLVIITRDQIARSPARSVPDLLKAYAGITVNHWTAGQSDVAVRGGVQTYNPRLLVLVNGRQVYLDHYGMTDWNLLGVELDEIQQIELVRGPASALFGFNAASGVVNIITVDPLNARTIAATGEIGTHGQSRIGGVVSMPVGAALGLKLSGSHQREDERAIPADLYRPGHIDDVSADQAGVTLAFHPDTMTRAELNGAWSTNQQLEYLPSQVLSQQAFRTLTAGARLDHDTGWGSLDGSAYANWLNARYGETTARDDPFADLAALHVRNRIVVAQGSALVRLGDTTTLRLGGEYRDNQLTSDLLYSREIGYRVAAASGMIDLHPADRLSLTLAARVDHLSLRQTGAPTQPAVDQPGAFDRELTPVSFNAAVLLDVGDKGQLRFNGGRGIQSPSLSAFGLRLPVPLAISPLPVFVLGDPALQPAIVWSGEVGYARRFGTALRLNGSLFFTRTNDALATPGNPLVFSIVTSPTPAVITRFTNVGWYESYGAEVSAEGGIVPGVTWRANYTWTHTREALLADRNPYVFALLPRATTPVHSANLTVEARHGRWSLDVVNHYTSATRQFAFTPASTLLLVPVRQAVAVDAKLGLRLRPGLTGYVAGENLTDAKGASGSPIPADRRLRLGLSVSL